jgi:hypothetical protein
MTDFEELFACLKAHHAKALVVGDLADFEALL